MPPKAKKTKKELEEEKSKLNPQCLSFQLHVLTVNCASEKLEEEKRIQEELERKRQEEEEKQRRIAEEKLRVEEEKRKAEEEKRLIEEAVSAFISFIPLA